MARRKNPTVTTAAIIGVASFVGGLLVATAVRRLRHPTPRYNLFYDEDEGGWVADVFYKGGFDRRVFATEQEAREWAIETVRQSVVPVRGVPTLLSPVIT